jgi:hypothetical protein
MSLFCFPFHPVPCCIDFFQFAAHLLGDLLLMAEPMLTCLSLRLPDFIHVMLLTSIDLAQPLLPA